MLDVLQELVAHYKVSVVLCTATQPALQHSPHFKGLRDVREIVPDPTRYFAALKRVRYTLPMQHERWTWERVAAEMQSTEQCLIVVNTRTDVLRLLDELPGADTFHLSTLLCGAHRRDVLNEVRNRLRRGDPCHLVSTQVVEAGVDLDFPMVLRAVGPLDRIVQAAGRCNREGRLEAGDVVIFWPEDGKVPPGAYRTGTDTAMSLLNQPHTDLHDPILYQTYFERLYQGLELDAKGIQQLRQALDFPEVARRFRLIDDDTEAVVVHYTSPVTDEQQIRSLLAVIREQNEIPRWALRRLQPYLVNIRRRLIPEYHREGFLHELTPGLWEWLGGYDFLRGLVVTNRDPAELVI
jgi:CRISPR-associated endonuclease/helicase Cas3